MKLARIALIVVAVLALSLAGVFSYFSFFANARIAQELIDDPDGERAQKVMLITLPSGRRLPVNYLREGDLVFAAADGGWGKELDTDGLLEAEGHPVTVFVRGEALAGSARAVRDDPEYTKAVFARLRPNAIPGFGTLIEVKLRAAR